MSSVRTGRRHFLLGAGGFSLALPLLPSLVPSKVLAQAAPSRRFVAFATHHGGIWGGNMFPGDEQLSEQQSLYADHTIRRGDLTATLAGGRREVSPVLSAAADRLSDRILGKMNILRGLDVPFYIGHHTGGHLGNYARNDGNGDSGVVVQGDPMPTIDQVLAWSPSFYSDLSSIRQRSLHLGRDGGAAISWGFSSPLSQDGTVQPMPSTFNSSALFDAIFVPDAPASEQRTPVVDRVLQAYRRLHDGSFGDAQRISQADRRRLSDHMDRLFELERRLTVSVASCGDITAPALQVGEGHPGFGGYSTDPPAMAEYYRTMNEVIAAAFICGTSRIVTINSTEIWANYVGDWHQEIAHMAHTDDGAAQGVIAPAHQRFFEDAYLDLVNRLDIDEGDGTTILDNSLVMWSQESGPLTHDSISVPVVTAGSAGGFFRTGQYLDYRNRDNLRLSGNDSTLHLQQRPGILYTQWLATILQSMGLSPVEFERDGAPGYGSTYRDNYFGSGGPEAWPDRLFADASEVPPWMRA